MSILTADMERVIDEQKLGFVATVCDDGTPSLSPKSHMRLPWTVPQARLTFPKMFYICSYYYDRSLTR
jgi:predicted pyridoxine 5'-phosphate oxidase superfamily flavin-nucleotide-binding protein